MRDADAVHCAKVLNAALQPGQERLLGLRFAKLTGFNRPSLEGVRGMGSSSSHYLFEEGDVLMDVQFETRTASNIVSMVGQIFKPERAEGFCQRAVSLLHKETKVAGTETNAFGEFHLQFVPRPDMLLAVELQDASYFLSWLPPANVS